MIAEIEYEDYFNDKKEIENIINLLKENPRVISIYHTQGEADIMTIRVCFKENDE